MSKYKGKKVLVVGLGKSGVAVTRFMSKQGAKLSITDHRQKSDLTEAMNSISDVKAELELGKHTEKPFQWAELIVLSPGVNPSLSFLAEARERKVPITCEVELAVQTIKEPIVSVTGTNGKTTTTTMIGEMFKADGKSAYVGGNIGRPLLDYVNEGQKADVVVAELSSFQIDLMQKLTPAVAVFTNVAENHLDRYPDYPAYVASKRKLLSACDKNSFVVLNRDNPETEKFGDGCPGKLLWFSRRNPMELGGQFAEGFKGAYLRHEDKKIVAKISGREEVYDLSQFRPLGLHNRENFMAAACAARAMGVSAKAVQKTADEFRGVPHRLEFVRRKDGVYFFNDSKSTTPMSLRTSLEAFQASPIILIAGGRDKNSEYGGLSELVKRKCKILILLGEAKEKLNRALGDFTDTFLVGTFEEAILLAYQKSRSGDIILLSPGCTSYDMFRSFEERGDYFRRLVNQL